jgi:hypothetical protein
MEMSSQLCSRGKCPWCPLVMRLGGLQSQSGCGNVRKWVLKWMFRVVSSYQILSLKFYIYFSYFTHLVSGIALDYVLDDRGFESRQGLSIFLLTTAFRPALGPTQPSIQWVPGALSPGVNRPGREADHSPHIVPRSRMRGAILPYPQYSFIVWCLVKA